MVVASFLDEPPQLDRVSHYDEAHLASYIRLLDAEAEGADWREVVAIVFGLNPDNDTDYAKRVHDSHLARARWMRDHGFRHLLESRLQ